MNPIPYKNYHMFPTLRRAVSSHGLKCRPKLEIGRIRASEEERNAARLSYHNIQDSLNEFHKNGLVILENAVERRSIEHVHHRMLQDFVKHSKSSNLRWNQGRDSGNISQSPPSLPEYLHEDIWANRLCVDIMENIIGPRPQLSFATSNIALPKSTGRQAVHSDYYCNHLDFPVFLEVNIYLHDIDSRNGATEFWLGTHKGYSKDHHSSPTTGWIKQEVFMPRATISPPIQPAISKGSLMIRDLRCWHAGRENQTSEPRIILGFLYSPSWFGSHMRMKFPHSSRPHLESWSHIDCLKTAEFVTDEFDYLANHQDINLTQTPSDLNAPYTSKHQLGEVKPQDYWMPP
ncbi:hypothetical protein GQ44DRAFT_712552 [Phaeosphaeriaceae sp. PMI808]|nr:hypothetical protein GQ44DRAFT_712552 [Phaeosphaeriaceae sp. PMI808]